jgi:hypothetical protein
MESDIRNALKTLPKMLAKGYERTPLGIPDTDRHLARRALLYVYRHQKLVEQRKVDGRISTNLLEQAIFYNIEGDFTMDDSYVVHEICGCLVVLSTYKESRDIATLAHYTVQEFLFSDHIANNPNSVHTKPLCLIMLGYQEKCHSTCA